MTETVIASFLLAAGFLVVIGLLHSALRYTSQVSKVVTATTLAERTVNEIRVWALDINNFRSNWALYDNTTYADPEHGDFRIKIECSKSTGPNPIPALESPCSNLEAAYLPADRKKLVNSSRRVRVSVSWSPHTSASTYRLVSLIEEPRVNWRAANPIQVTASSLGPIAPLGTVTLTAQAYDDKNQVIPDVMFQWFVEPGAPIPTVATITQSRDGSTATLLNQVQVVTGANPPPAMPGAVKAAVRGIYRGQECWGLSKDIQLQ